MLHGMERFRDWGLGEASVFRSTPQKAWQRFLLNPFLQRLLKFAPEPMVNHGGRRAILDGIPPSNPLPPTQRVGGVGGGGEGGPYTLNFETETRHPRPEALDPRLGGPQGWGNHGGGGGGASSTYIIDYTRMYICIFFLHIHIYETPM